MEPTGIHAAGRDGGAAGDDGVSLDIIGCRDARINNGSLSRGVLVHI